MIQIDPESLRVLQQLLQHYLPKADVWVFGSRLHQTAQPYSDLDLLVRPQQEITFELFLFKEALSESNIPFSIDITHWDHTTPEFRELILKDAYPLSSLS